MQRSVQITQILFTTLVEGHMPADEESRSYFLELIFALHPASFDDQILLCSMFDSYRCNKVRDALKIFTRFAIEKMRRREEKC